MMIGIVGPADSVERAVKVTSKFHVGVVQLIYERHDQIPQMLHKYVDKLDGILFTGKVPYIVANQHLTINIPFKYVQHDNTTLHRILFHINYHHHLDITRFSIDLFKETEVEEILYELNLPFQHVYVNEFNTRNLEENTNFHLKLYEQGKIDYCITAMLSTLKELEAKGIPVFRVVPTQFAIRKTFEVLLLEIESLISKEAQVSVGIFNIDNFKNVMRDYPEYQWQLMKLKLYRMLLEYGKETHSSVIYTGGDEYFVYTTKGEVTRGLKDSSPGQLLKRIKKYFPSFTVSYGIGEGTNVSEATTNARIALREAKNKSGNCAYLRNSNGILIGPLEECGALKIDSSQDNEELDRLSNKLGMSKTTIEKIRMIIRRKDKLISAYDFANEYGCSIRSARRILAILERHGYAKVEKHSLIYEKGRPRRYYRLNI